MDALTATAFAKIARVDPPRIDPRTGHEEPKVRLRIVCSTVNMVLPGGHLVFKGENHIEAYASDEPKIQKLVETIDATGRADVNRELGRRVERWRKDNPGADERTMPHSFEAAFHHVMGRDLLPLESVEVIEGNGKKPASKAA